MEQTTEDQAALPLELPPLIPPLHFVAEDTEKIGPLEMMPLQPLEPSGTVRPGNMRGNQSHFVATGVVKKSASADASDLPEQFLIAAAPRKTEPLVPALVCPNGKCAVKQPGDCPGGKCLDRKFGTQITWTKTVEQASKLARDQNKMVFLIQISGNFELEEFT